MLYVGGPFSFVFQGPHTFLLVGSEMGMLGAFLDVYVPFFAVDYRFLTS